MNDEMDAIQVDPRTAELALFKHEVVARLVRCRCGRTMTPAAFDEHFRAEVRETAHRVIARALRDAL